jgi:hypothetical protein
VRRRGGKVVPVDSCDGVEQDIDEAEEQGDEEMNGSGVCLARQVKWESRKWWLKWKGGDAWLRRRTRTCCHDVTQRGGGAGVWCVRTGLIT